MNATLIRGVTVGALAGLLFGFDTAVIAGTTSGVRDAFALDAGGVGITVSSALWGTLIGALTAGIPGDRYGARTSLQAIALLYILSGVGCLLAWDWGALLLFRVMAGLAVGASSVLAPVYIAEIAPAEKRGAMVGAFQLNVVFGILVAYLSNFFVSSLDLGAWGWRVKFGVTAVPAVIRPKPLAAANSATSMNASSAPPWTLFWRLEWRCSGVMRTRTVWPSTR